MLVKKLITLAGALGILACGACFLPDLINRQPPPPLIPAMQSIKTIAVTVKNSSSTQHIDARLVAVAIAKRLNLVQSTPKIKAWAVKEGELADATLTITILEERATPSAIPSSPSTLWLFEQKVSASLIRSNGQLI
jgi:hypothetical protein